jgi:hypothetical protein
MAVSRSNDRATDHPGGNMRFAARTITAVAALMTLAAATACSSGLTIPSDDDGNNPAGGSGATALDSALSGGGRTRIEIHLLPGTLVAREVHVERDDQEEKLVSRISGLDPVAGTVTLELGGLTVTYGAGTRFRTDEESHESRSAWEAAVRQELDAGRRPLIEVRRNPSAEPQSPDDPSFIARDLRLEEEDDDGPKIEIYVDDDNLRSGASSAVLRVLGLDIVVDDSASSGTSSVEFEMGVTGVDVAGGTLVLSNGTRVLVTAETAISAEGDLFTLAATADAVTLGRPVRAEGRGTVASSEGPTVIAATSLKIEVDD